MASGTSSAPRVRIGRPISPQLTEATIRSLAAKVAKGIPQGAAAGSIGIPRRTFQNWLAAGRASDAEEPYRSLALEVDLAVDRYHASRVVHLHRIGKDDPKVVMWELEHRFRDDWGDPDRGSITVNVGLIVDSPEWAALRDRALEALAAFPEALGAYIAAVGGQVIDGDAVEVLELEP